MKNGFVFGLIIGGSCLHLGKNNHSFSFFQNLNTRNETKVFVKKVTEPVEKGY